MYITDWKQRLGARVKQLRQERNMTQREMAERAGLSLRFAADVEAGKANPSLGSLYELAAALRVEVISLLQESHAPQVDAATASSILAKAASHKKSIALLGLRGAGKSTVGELLAQKLGWSFVEVDRHIEQECGLSLPSLFELHGEEYYRSSEARILEKLTATGAKPTVFATGGGVVLHAQSWEILQARTTTIWLKASAQAHWDRVVAQGDLRPMANRSRARIELDAIYAARMPLYARAHATVATDGLTPEEVATGVASACVNLDSAAAKPAV